jgi:uroporphyrin-III C-methyltransferase
MSKVWLVGAGPGDPGLITARGLELVRRCDALVYDRLVAPELVAEAPEDALRIGRFDLRQDQINQLLVDLASKGLDVVRLKGGDPFVFGRGGEEALALAEAGIELEVVPGVSALAAVPAAADIPLTHRGVSAEVKIASGRSADGDAELAVAAGSGTLVLFMALNELPALTARLLKAGVDASTPAAAISRGTRPDQEVVVSDLAGIAAAAGGLPGPALVVIGHVVSLRERVAELRAAQPSISAPTASTNASASAISA